MSGQTLSDAERERLRATVRGMLEEAEAVLSAVPAEEQPHSTEEDVAVCYARLGDFASAMRLVDHWSDQYDRANTLMSIATCLRHLGNQSDALATIEEAIVATRLSECRDSMIWRLTTLTELLIDWGESSRARSLLSETTAIAREAIDPDALCGPSWMTELIECQLRLSGSSAAEQVVSELLDHLPGYRWVQLQNIAHWLATAGRFDDAVELAKSIPELPLRASALHGIADAHESREIATTILLECASLYAHRLDPDGRAAGLRSLAKSMHGRSMDSDAKQSLLAARDSLMELSSLYYRAIFLADLAPDFADTGRPDDVRETLALAEQVVDTTPDPSSRMYQCIAIAEAYLKIGDRDKARSRFEAAAAFASAADEDNEEFWLPCEVVDSAAQAGFTELAHSIADDLTSDRRIHALAMIAEAALSYEKHETAQRLVEEMLQLITELDDPESKADNLCHISLKQLRLSDLDNAVVTARSIDNEFTEQRAGAFMHIASMLLDQLGAPTGERP